MSYLVRTPGCIANCKSRNTHIPQHGANDGARSAEPWLKPGRDQVPSSILCSEGWGQNGSASPRLPMTSSDGPITIRNLAGVLFHGQQAIHRAGRPAASTSVTSEQLARAIAVSTNSAPWIVPHRPAVLLYSTGAT